MMRALHMTWLGMGALALASMAQAGTPAPPPALADTVYLNGTIRTMEAPDAVAQAVAVRQGKILAVGSNQAMRAYAGPHTLRVNLHGRTMLPGFIDAHGHISGVAAQVDFANLSSPPVSGVTDIASLQQALRDHIRNKDIAPDGWVQGWGYDDATLAEHRHPTRQELDAVSTDRPILLFHTSGHLAVANSKALEMAHLLNGAPNPPNGVIRRDADGKTASGVLEEAAVFAIGALLPRPTLDQRVSALDKAQHVYSSYGITTAQDGAISPADYAALQEAARRKALFIDIGALLFFRAPWQNLEALPIGADYQDHLRILGLKLMLDGSPQGRTAWLSQPYHHAPEGLPVDYHGYAQVKDDELRGWLNRAADHDWQVFVHVNGDQAMQQLIDQIAAVDATRAKPVERTIAIHSQVVTPGQLERMKALDIQPSFFVAHTFYWGDWHRQVTLGEPRAERISPLAEALTVGLTPSTHNDAPVVPPDIMRLVWSSVARKTRTGFVLGQQERVSAYDALLMVTRNAAWQIHEEIRKGTITPGKDADLVVLDRDPVKVKPDSVQTIHIMQTIKNGRLIFKAQWETAPFSPSL
ncbi:amidohydrolase [Sphingobium sp.]|uniref:amidohydrolase n=1 Tax=Sphingobium sp. TaxID=1912891 RepID=UPI002C659309|nr:amidohydrolase [Sphingobium sp.]HUD91691.1 amidohydrolase [Sphingobium sp.]